MSKIISNTLGAVKLLIAFFLLKTVYRNIYNMNYWLICEKPSEARDNGYHFYKFIRENHPEINIYYVIASNSSDLHKVDCYQNVIFYNSFKHYIYYLASRVCLSSQSLPYPCSRRLCEIFSFLKRKNTKTVWLQHGITKDKLSHKDMDYSIFKYDLLSCSAERESKFIQNEYGYSAEQAKVVGMCRYDNLLPMETENIILVMPTFRSNLVASNQSKKASLQEKKQFMKSSFYKTYISLLSSPKLIQFLKKNNYKIIFYPHYALQSYIETFFGVANDCVVVADRMHYDVQKLLLQSKLLITDYSSVFFDFAYMKKPELFYQFDKSEYRAIHYKQGYFDYQTDAFGKVVFNLDEVTEEIVNLFQNNFVLPKKYKERSNSFFAFNDLKNCERTYNAVMALVR